ncbi:MAG TPA: polyphosphate kinase 1, partial [Acidimicrobiia bacterium]
MNRAMMTVGEPVAENDRYIDRELSWLDFDARVMALAESESIPLLERIKFLAIFSSNLDEYFETRVAALKERAEAPTAMAALIGQQLGAVHTRTVELVARQSQLFAKTLAPALVEIGFEIVNYDDLDVDDREFLRAAFDERIYPVLTPLAVDPAHPFPYVSNVSLNLAVVVRDTANAEERFARVKVPPLLPRFVALADGRRFLPVEQVIAAHLDALFPGMTIVSHNAFRVTRDVEIELSDDSEDLLEAIEFMLQRTTKGGRAVRLEIAADAPAATVQLLLRELELGPDDLYMIDGMLDLTSLFPICDLDRPELKYPPYRQQTPPEFERLGGSIFEQLRDHDVLVHHPYDSFDTTVGAFVEAAATDPAVLAIKQTLYRTGGEEADITASLAKAALGGKQVVVLVELTARGDEQHNVTRARTLEEAGAHVVYGIVGLKTHAKILLVVRRERDGLRRYCHVGTGNYNVKTARTYEDLGLFSSDTELAADVAELFNFLTGYSRPRDYRRLLIAPGALRGGVIERIAAQARPGGRIVMKMNALVDTEMIQALYAASDAGAEIDLIVRGVCCLRPGVPGLSERIRVRSLLGRYLEHSRIFRFGDGNDDTTEWYMGSADLMPRNLDRRVEALVCVTETGQRRRLDEVLEISLADDELAWELRNDGTWHTVATVHHVNAHEAFEGGAIARAAGRD